MCRNSTVSSDSHLQIGHQLFEQQHLFKSARVKYEYLCAVLNFVTKYATLGETGGSVTVIAQCQHIKDELYVHLFIELWTQLRLEKMRQDEIINANREK